MGGKPQAAPDGRRGLALANINRWPQPVVWRTKDVSAGETVYRINGRGCVPLGQVRGDGLLYEEEVPARTVQVIEVGP